MFLKAVLSLTMIGYWDTAADKSTRRTGGERTGVKIVKLKDVLKLEAAAEAAIGSFFDANSGPASAELQGEARRLAAEAVAARCLLKLKASASKGI